MIQMHRPKQPGLIHSFPGTEQESEYTAHWLLLCGNAASLFIQSAGCLEAGKQKNELRIYGTPSMMTIITIPSD
jgi:hypothetical protein